MPWSSLSCFETTPSIQVSTPRCVLGTKTRDPRVRGHDDFQYMDPPRSLPLLKEVCHANPLNSFTIATKGTSNSHGRSQLHVGTAMINRLALAQIEPANPCINRPARLHTKSQRRLGFLYLLLINLYFCRTLAKLCCGPHKTAARLCWPTPGSWTPSDTPATNAVRSGSPHGQGHWQGTIGS